MKKVKYALASLVLLMPLVVAVRVTAQGDTSDDNSQSTTETTENETEKPEDATKRKERLEKRKDELKLRLSTAEQQRLKLRCKASQAVIKNLGNRINANVPKRHRSYDQINQLLLTIIEKLNAKGVDTTELKSEQEILAQKIAAFKTDLESYKEVLSDLYRMDCTTDTEAFKASLESARTMREKLAQSDKDIQSYIKETIKTTLSEIRAALPAQNDNSSSGESEGGQ